MLISMDFVLGALLKESSLLEEGCFLFVLVFFSYFIGDGFKTTSSQLVSSS